MKSDVKQVIVMRKDLNMRKGKIAAQACHASLSAIMRAMLKNDCFEWGYNENEQKIYFKPEYLTDENKDLTEWFSDCFKKIVVYVNSEQELIDLYNIAQELGIICSLVTDKGLTEFNQIPTKTCLAFEPLESAKIDILTGQLPLL